MFTTGRIIFVCLFIIIFIIGMLFAYRKDLKSIKHQYSGIYLMFLFISVFLLGLFLLVKFWHK